jgi:hypothetical protein
MRLHPIECHDIVMASLKRQADPGRTPAYRASHSKGRVEEELQGLGTTFDLHTHRPAFRRVARTHMGTFDVAMVRRSELRSSAPQVHCTLGPYPQKDDAGLTEGPTKMNIFGRNIRPSDDFSSIFFIGSLFLTSKQFH